MMKYSGLTILKNYKMFVKKFCKYVKIEKKEPNHKIMPRS